MKKTSLTLSILLLLFAGGVYAETTIEDLQQLQSTPSTLEQLLNPYAYAQTCFKSGEKIDQMGLICYYKCSCGEKALNFELNEFCPFQEIFNC
tara:strand:+ start:37 stop:315 length:279 start_codon:yes stop_codon:yes gene_type:complete